MQKNFSRWITLGVIFVIICVLLPTCVVRCTKVDSAEVGIKFNKLSLTDQGKLDFRVLLPHHNGCLYVWDPRETG